MVKARNGSHEQRTKTKLEIEFRVRKFKITMATQCTGVKLQSIALAFEHCVLLDRVRQELSVDGASRK